MIGGFARLAFPAALLLALFPGAGSGQVEPAEPRDNPSRVEASARLPIGHWALRAVARADELGALSEHLPGQRLLTISEAEAALREAAATFEGGALGGLTRGWHERFLNEYPGAARPDSAESPRVQGASVRLSYLSHDGPVAPGRAVFPPDRTGATPLRDDRGVAASVAVAATFGSAFAARLEPAVDPEGARVAVAEVVTGFHAWSLSVGRQAVGYGWFESGGVVLSGAQTLDRVELGTRRPVRIPLMRGLGPVAIHTFLTRMAEERHPGEPYMWGARVALAPHRRVRLAIHRAAMFGGAGSDEPITVTNVLRMLGGGLGGRGFENQIVSAAGRVDLPTEALIPVTAYAEWGAEDAAGAWSDVPGIVAGVRTPAVPGFPELSGGFEVSSLSASCCGNPPWYRHTAFPGSWAAGQLPLGHPLGGSGSELAVYSSMDLARVGLHLQGRAFRRERGAENLFAPERAGVSTGVLAEVAWRVGRRSELNLEVTREAGDGWAETRAEVRATMFSGLWR